jgi:hypothetical protein
MKRLFFRLTALLCGLFPVYLVNAQSTQQLNVTTTAVPFLRISPDARAGGLGEEGIATSPDANSAFYNLSKTPFSEYKTGIAVTYTPWLKDLGLTDVYLLAATGFHKLNDNEALSASIRYFSLGSIQFSDNTGQSWGEGRPFEYAIDLGYSRKLSEKFGIGLTMRYIYSNLTLGAVPTNGGSISAYKPGTSVAADLSLTYKNVAANQEGWTLGFVLSNLGTKIGYTNDATIKEFIPANMGIGGNYTKVFDEQNKISFGLDLNKLLVPAYPVAQNGADTVDQAAIDAYYSQSVVSSWFKSFNGQFNTINASVGAEYTYNDQFAFRLGYFYESQEQGGRQYFTMGVGLKYNMIGLNFSYLIPSGSGITRNPLSNTIRFGLIFDLDGPPVGTTTSGSDQ